MSWLRGSKITPVGLDIGRSAIKAVQLERGGGGWHIRSAAAIMRGDSSGALNGDLGRQIRMMLLRGGFVGNKLVLAVPAFDLEVQLLDLPPRSSGAPIEQLAQIEIARSPRLNAEPFEMACWELPASARAMAGTPVLAVAVPASAAACLLDPLESEDFDVVALDTQSWAVARVCDAPSASGTITSVFDLGWSGSLMTLLQDGTVIYQRSLEQTGMEGTVRSLCDEFGFSEKESELVLLEVGLRRDASSDWGDAARFEKLTRLIQRHFEAVLEEIAAALNYAAHRHPQHPVARICVVGGGSLIPGVCQLLGARLRVDASVLAPAALASCPKDLVPLCSSGLLTTAMGLAAYEA